MQHEVDMDGIKGKDHAAVVVPLQYAGGEAVADCPW
jgi:hypothetical protein